MNSDPYDAEGQTVSTPEGGGCLPLFAIPPLSVLVISAFLILFWGRLPAVRSTEKIVETSTLAPLFTPEIHYWAPEIQKWAKTWKLNPNLIATIMQIESCGDPLARSSAGAAGLFQVMPFHFEALENPYHPETNATRGLAYLEKSLESFDGDIEMAFAGYNAGINGARQGEANWPAETIRYVRWGVGIYLDAQAGKKESATLNEWLAKGGASLCVQAAKRIGLAP